MEFSEKLRNLRAELLISQKELAEELGVTYVTISRLENGRVEPSFLTQKKFEALCKRKEIFYDD